MLVYQRVISVICPLQGLDSISISEVSILLGLRTQGLRFSHQSSRHVMVVCLQWSQRRMTYSQFGSLKNSGQKSETVIDHNLMIPLLIIIFSNKKQHGGANTPDLQTSPDWWPDKRPPAAWSRKASDRISPLLPVIGMYISSALDIGTNLVGLWCERQVCTWKRNRFDKHWVWNCSQIYLSLYLEAEQGDQFVA